MMLKIEFTAATPSEIADITDTMARIAAALRPVGMHPALGASFTPSPAPVPHTQPVSVSDTSAKRGPGRPRKSADPVDAYVAAGGVMPTSTADTLDAEQQLADNTAPSQVEVPEPPATLESEITQAEATFNPEVAPPPASLDELRAQIRTIAQDRGALWLRPLLEAAQ